MDEAVDAVDNGECVRVPEEPTLHIELDEEMEFLLGCDDGQPV